MSDWKADMAALKGRSEEEANAAQIDEGSQTQTQTQTPPQDQGQAPPAAPVEGRGDAQTQDPNAQAKKALTAEEYEARHNQNRGALREERGKRREAEKRAQETAAQLQAYAQQTAQLQQTVQALMARQLAGQPAQAPANAPNAYAQQGYQGAPADQSPYIDPNEVQANPLQALARMVEHNNRQQYEAQQREAAERQRQIENARQQQEGLERARYVHTLTSSIDEAEAVFAEDYPDYGDASKFLVDTAMEQLKVRFPALAANPQALHQQVTVEMLTMAEQARAAGMDPAQVYYNAAKALGFGRASTPAPAATGQGAPLAAQTTPAAADPLAAIRAGQAAARSSGAGGDAALSDGRSLSDILALDGAAFASATRKFLATQTGKSGGRIR